jgi:two-component system sensor histidine kinase/response regulator
VTKSDIMIVDDNPANLRLLEDMLLEKGHEVRSFPLGRLALASAMNDPPDLILMDVNMPEMNGYEVCKRLKSIAKLADIPVIFLSALSETQDKVTAFQSGAVDYISKPFQFEEVHARVETHLELHALKQALEKTVALRTRELAEANRRLTILDQSKSDFLGLISHEFRTPLNGLLGVGELILEDVPATAQNDALRGVFAQSRRRILSILDDAQLLAQIDVKADHFKAVPVSLDAAVACGIESASDFAKSRGVIISSPPPEHVFVLSDLTLLNRALHALLETAVKFSEKNETVRLASAPAEEFRQVTIESRGRSIPSASLPKFFDIFSIGEAITPGGDLGLGPPVAQRILSLFGASVTVANQEPSGILLTITMREAKIPPDLV